MLPHVDDLAPCCGCSTPRPPISSATPGGLHLPLTAIRIPSCAQPRARRAAGAVALHQHPPRARELLPLFARRPRTALSILGSARRRPAPPRRPSGEATTSRRGRSFAAGLLGKEGYERLPEERRQQARENVNTLRAQLLGAGFPPLSDDEVRGVAAPTLLMTGERSPAFLLRLTDRLQQLLPNRRARRDRRRVARDDARRTRQRLTRRSSVSSLVMPAAR